MGTWCPSRERELKGSEQHIIATIQYMHCTAHDNSYRQDERWQPMGFRLGKPRPTDAGFNHTWQRAHPASERTYCRTELGEPGALEMRPCLPKKNSLPLSRFVSNLDFPSNEPIHHLLDHGPSRWRQRNAREGLGKCASIFPLRLWRRLSFVGHTNATRSKIHRIFEQRIIGAR